MNNLYTRRTFTDQESCTEKPITVMSGMAIVKLLLPDQAHKGSTNLRYQLRIQDQQL
jgi:hypothetical protein